MVKDYLNSKTGFYHLDGKILSSYEAIEYLLNLKICKSRLEAINYLRDMEVK